MEDLALSRLDAIEEALRLAWQSAGQAPDPFRFRANLSHSLEAHLPALRADFASRLMNHSDRPPGFVGMRRSICATPSTCFEFSDAAPECSVCDATTVVTLAAVRTDQRAEGIRPIDLQPRPARSRKFSLIERLVRALEGSADKSEAGANSRLKEAKRLEHRAAALRKAAERLQAKAQRQRRGWDG